MTIKDSLGRDRVSRLVELFWLDGLLPFRASLWQPGALPAVPEATVPQTMWSETGRRASAGLFQRVSRPLQAALTLPSGQEQRTFVSSPAAEAPAVIRQNGGSRGTAPLLVGQRGAAAAAVSSRKMTDVGGQGARWTWTAQQRLQAASSADLCFFSGEGVAGGQTVSPKREAAPLSVQLEMVNHNTISSELELEQVVRRLSEQVAESLQSAAEVLHR